MTGYLPLGKITKGQFAAYESVRQSGRWNMFDPNAQRASGLDRKTYISVLHYYSELNKKWPDVRRNTQ